jgi:alkyl sulfatase BDS1-like metallo-beta-lactamase superfamily hydrolase
MPAEGASPPQHFDKLGEPPSMFTLELRNGLKAKLPFDDMRDYDEAKRASSPSRPTRRLWPTPGRVAWDMGSYGWLLPGKDFESINPSLQRQAVLNMLTGSTKSSRIASIRSAATTSPNISFIKGNTDWIIFDPLTAKETARAALEFVNDKPGAVRWWASSTRIRTSTTSAACAGWLTKLTSPATRSR